MSDENGYESHIDPLGQSPGLWNLYTQLTFCYSMPNDETQQNVADTLKNGLQKLTLSFPWVAGQVVREREVPEQFVIKSYKNIPTLVVKDAKNQLPDFDTYRRSNFPSSLFDENVIAPRNTKSVVGEDVAKPVFLLQVTFIIGGLLLTFAAQHGTMDIVGQAEVIRLLSKACHGELFTSEEIEVGNRDRRNTIPLLTKAEAPSAGDATDTKQESPPLEQDTNQSCATASSEFDPSPKNIWAYFTFPATALHALKVLETKSIPPSTPFISTDDVLSAFIWQCISRARLPHLSPNASTTFARTVDLRRYLSIPASYPGNLATKTFTTHTFNSLLNAPLGQIAAEFRCAIDPNTSEIVYQARVAATKLVRPVEDKMATKPARDLSRDVAFSSWGKVDWCHELDFNLGLRGPEAVRRPTFAPPGEQPMEGVVYLMPKRQNGALDVMVCLRKEDMQRLKMDEQWCEFATYVG